MTGQAVKKDVKSIKSYLHCSIRAKNAFNVIKFDQESLKFHLVAAKHKCNNI